MEGNYWNRDDDRDNRDRYDNRQRTDEDSYRGAYRLDTTSDHRNESTWDGFDSRDQNRRRGNDYNQNYNNDYNRNYNQDYNSYSRGNDRNRGYDHDNYNMNSRYRDSNNRDEHYRSTGGYGTRFGGDSNQQHRSVHDRISDRDGYSASGNFNPDYGPDYYGQGGGANYGNQAGSLSFGYDGSSNYDRDWNRHYDPLTGRRHSYHGNYTSRHPEQNERNRNNKDDRY
ncbi:hypothetical protein POKO110462_22035 [Pontibacter korlensis]|uniref:hypothetical protein n=1 Tax=Pontibacter korlensis TaxID=400092 RepID=UPI000698A494|nr:hypothetical protein [Pontibacter korlensis]